MTRAGKPASPGLREDVSQTRSDAMTAIKSQIMQSIAHELIRCARRQSNSTESINHRFINMVRIPTPDSELPEERHAQAVVVTPHASGANHCFLAAAGFWRRNLATGSRLV
jgi:hypothetical protein